VEDLVANPTLDYAREISRDWKPAFEVSSALGQTEAVKAAAGIGILHGFIAREHSELVEILPHKRIKRSYWLSYHESARTLRRIHIVADFVSGLVEQERHLFS
jgi:DNA-binding transcriptional LysR family regulator